MKKELRLQRRVEEVLVEEDEEIVQQEDYDAGADEEEDVEDDGAYSLIKMLESDSEDEED